jgi:predicted S18 family serine protease
MAELEQDAALALLLLPAAGAVAELLVLVVLLAHPASPALAASTAIAAIAATVICLIPALLVLARTIKRIIIPNGRGACSRAPPSPGEAKCYRPGGGY